MRLIKDIHEFSHRTKSDGFESLCRVRIFSDGSRNVVVYEETGVGRSVTNGAESIVTGVCNTYGLDPNCTLFVEYYSGFHLKPYMNEDEASGSFDFVKFDVSNDNDFSHLVSLTSPQWRRTTRGTVEELCGCKI